MISFEFYLKKWQEKTQKPLWFLGFLEPISFSVHNFGCGGRTRTYGLVFSLRRKYCGRFGGSDSPPDCHSLPPHPSSFSQTLRVCLPVRGDEKIFGRSRAIPRFFRPQHLFSPRCFSHRERSEKRPNELRSSCS